MKKLIIVCEILMVSILLAKIAVVGGIVGNSKTAEDFFSVNDAAADSLTVTAPADAPAVPAKNVREDTLSKERKLLSSLLEKQKALNSREAVLISEERKLNSLKDEILSKIDKLEETEKRVTILLEAVKKINDQKYMRLAKVYEAAPPEQAGAMLEKLDTKTAAAIIMSMKSKKAGAILGYVKPGKAVEITREITSQTKKAQPLKG